MNIEFTIDARSAIPVYQQIKQEVRRLILSGTYKPGDQLIPIRELAKQLSVNPNTVVKVYYQLDVEGFVHARPGQGYFVSEIDESRRNDDRQDLFVLMLDEFLMRIGKMGFGPDDLIKELKKRLG